MNQLRKEGTAIVYISHKLAEIRRICDRYTVMKDGSSVCSGMVSDVSNDDIVRLMVGRELQNRFNAMNTPTAKKVTQLVNVEEHVEGFRQVREAHRRELIDDYVELISDLIREVGEARQVDMAARLGVSQPTVAKMLKRLATMGLIEMIPWRGVFLTAEPTDRKALMSHTR